MQGLPFQFTTPYSMHVCRYGRYPNRVQQGASEVSFLALKNRPKECYQCYGIHAWDETVVITLCTAITTKN